MMGLLQQASHPFLNNNPNALLIVNQWGFNATSGIDVNDDTDRW